MYKLLSLVTDMSDVHFFTEFGVISTHHPMMRFNESFGSKHFAHLLSV